MVVGITLTQDEIDYIKSGGGVTIRNIALPQNYNGDIGVVIGTPDAVNEWENASPEDEHVYRREKHESNCTGL